MYSIPFNTVEVDKTEIKSLPVVIGLPVAENFSIDSDNYLKFASENNGLTRVDYANHTYQAKTQNIRYNLTGKQLDYWLGFYYYEIEQGSLPFTIKTYSEYQSEYLLKKFVVRLIDNFTIEFYGSYFMLSLKIEILR